METCLTLFKTKNLMALKFNSFFVVFLEVTPDQKGGEMTRMVNGECQLIYASISVSNFTNLRHMEAERSLRRHDGVFGCMFSELASPIISPDSFKFHHFQERLKVSL